MMISSILISCASKCLIAAFINDLPIFFLLCSGSVVAESFGVSFHSRVTVLLRKKSPALMSFTSNPSFKSVMTVAVLSPALIKPLSMWSNNIFSAPTTCVSRAAMTVESTPPLASTKNFLSPASTCLTKGSWSISSLISSRSDCLSYPPSHPAIVYKKFSNTTRPLGLRSTSGWNCTPYFLCVLSSIPAHKFWDERALIANHGAGWVTVSPWVSKNVSSSCKPARRGDSQISLTLSCPSSLKPVVSTLPPDITFINCIP